MKVTIDLKPVNELVGSAARQLPFAVSLAMNYTAKDFQTAEREHIAAEFILRRPQFILNTVKIPRGGFATKSNLTVTVQIDPERDFLAKFELGGAKRPKGGGASIAVPLRAVQPSKYQIVRAGFRPKALNMRLVPTRTGKLQYKGDKRTFLLPRLGIFQRIGRGHSSSIVMLYSFRPAVTVPANLEFEATGVRIAQERWADNFNRAWEFAMATAR